MGLALEFYMGDPAVIGPAVADSDFDALYDASVVLARADLSLHLQPKDLDSLSREAARLLGREPILLGESLGDAIGGDEIDHGAFVVATHWVALFASLETEAASELTRRWMAMLAKQYEDPEIQSSPPAEEAVASLISLCRRAAESSTPVVHAWFL